MRFLNENSLKIPEIHLDKIPGLQESFTKAKVVLFTTFSEKGEKHIRQMTNLNEDPYSKMWFTSYTRSRKVEDLKRSPRVVISFPSGRGDDLYEIEGRAEFERRDVVEAKWSWWYLYWHPEQEDRFWFPRGEEHPEWTIINVHPESARLVKR